MHDDPVRLSRYICFVIYDNYVEVHHSARDSCQRVSNKTHSELCTYGGFTSLQEIHLVWLVNGTLVRPGCDHFEFHQGKEDSEADLARHYHQWYWQHEIESQREYRWFGQVAVKMPMDLFFYQELIHERQTSTILELGYGKGGALHFFSSILRLIGRGFIVGVDLKPCKSEITNIDPLPMLVHGDANDQETLEQVAKYSPTYDLIIIDLGGKIHVSLDVLPMWAKLLSVGGVIVIEDLWNDNNEASVTRKIDNFLCNHRNFGIYQAASRYPFLKGAVLIKEGL